MTEEFDPYYTWLGIPPEEQPPDHYRLLGIRRFETSDDVIANAADQRMAYIRTFQAGKRSKQSQALLNEIAAARGCLLDPRKRPQYDAELREKLAIGEAISGSAAVLPLDAMPPVLPVAVSLPEAQPPAAIPLGLPPTAPWGPLPPSSPPMPPPASVVPIQPFASPAAEHTPPVVSAASIQVRPRQRGVSLATALLVGGGTFALGLITLIATLVWAASQ